MPAVCGCVCVCVCVPLVNKACAKRQLVVFPQLDTLNAVTLEVNTRTSFACRYTHHVCTHTMRLLSKWYWFCPVFNLFSLITPLSSITITDEHGESLKSHPHANTFIHKCKNTNGETKCCPKCHSLTQMKNGWWKIFSQTQMIYF